MLVLSLRLGSKVWIGDVCVTVTDIDRNKCRIGIEADRSIIISRQELLSAAQIAERRQGLEGGKSNGK